MAWPIRLTPAMSDRLIEALTQYRDWTQVVETRAMLSVTLSMMERGVTLDKPEMLLVQAVIEDWLAQLDPDEYDEQLERAYYKLYGAWPVDPPWFVKAHGLPWPLE